MSKIEPIVRYAIYTRVSSVAGGYVHFEGSRERIYLGDHDFVEGDEVKITFQKGKQEDAFSS